MSILKANQWRDLNDNVMTPFVQAVTAQKTDTFYTNSTAWVDVTGLSVTITPTKATSRIMLYLHVSMSTYGHGGIRMLRNGSVIAAGDSHGSAFNLVTFWYYGTTSRNTTGYDSEAKVQTWVDSPNTTSAVTYKLQYANPYSSSYYVGINYNAYDDANAGYTYRNVSSITAVEVL
jgi:hypothetical protein